VRNLLFHSKNGASLTRKHYPARIGFWIAQRFSAATSGLSSTTALAAEVESSPDLDFFRKLFSRAALGFT
jgi:hypothetical protein